MGELVSCPVHACPVSSASMSTNVIGLIQLHPKPRTRCSRTRHFRSGDHPACPVYLQGTQGHSHFPDTHGFRMCELDHSLGNKEGVRKSKLSNLQSLYYLSVTAHGTSRLWLQIRIKQESLQSYQFHPAIFHDCLRESRKPEGDRKQFIKLSRRC